MISDIPSTVPVSSSHLSQALTASNDFDMASYCVGTPHPMNCVPSNGSIQLMMSLREDIIYLPCPRTVTSSSYREHDNSANLSSSASSDAPQPLQEANPSSSSNMRNIFRRRGNSVSSNSSINTQSNSSSSNDRTVRSSHQPRRTPQHIKNLIDSSIDPGSSSNDISPAVLHGSLLLKLSKPTKIKGISVKFSGKCTSTWVDKNHAEDIFDSSCYNELQEENIINSHTWEYAPSQSPNSSSSSTTNFDGLSVVRSNIFGADVVLIKPSINTSSSVSSSSPSSNNSSSNPPSSLTPGLHFKKHSKIIKTEPSANASTNKVTAPSPSLKSQTPRSSSPSLQKPKKSSRKYWPFRGNGKEASTKSQDSSESLKSSSATARLPNQNPRKPSGNRKATQRLALNNIPRFTPNYFKSTSDTTNPTINSTNDAILYPAGDYVFHFTLAIDPRTAETIKCNSGNIAYYLEAKVFRSSRFSGLVSAQREVTLVRSPPDISGTTNTASVPVSRQWDNRLHYEILCAKKYIPLGSSIPMSIKLTPMDKVQVHRVKVQALELVTYNSMRGDGAKFLDPVRKTTLCLMRAKAPEDTTTNDKEEDSQNKSSNDSTEAPKKKKNYGSLIKYTVNKDKPAPTSLPGVSQDSTITSNTQILEDEVLSTTTNITCNLSFVSQEGNSDSPNQKTTPSSEGPFKFRPDCIYNPYIHVKHRLHVSLRVSKMDPSDEKRRYFEVTIDTPIHLLSRHCKFENIELPLYDSIVGTQDDQTYDYYQNPIPYAVDHSADIRSSSTVAAINIPCQNVTGSHSTAHFDSSVPWLGSPEVSISPFCESLGSLTSNRNNLASSIIHPPSFEQALNDPLLIERPIDANRLSVSSSFLSLDGAPSSLSSALSRNVSSPTYMIHTGSSIISNQRQRPNDLNPGIGSSIRSESNRSIGDRIQRNDTYSNTSSHSTDSDHSADCLYPQKTSNTSRSSLPSLGVDDSGITSADIDNTISCQYLKDQFKSVESFIDPPPEYFGIVHETALCLKN